MPVWYTAVVPLPVALPDLMQRLRSNYYRQAAALQHDAETIASNAELYNGDGSDVAKAASGELLLFLHTGHLTCSRCWQQDFCIPDCRL